MRPRHALLLVAAVSVLAACATTSSSRSERPLALASKVDIPRFMGDWYVIAAIPTRFERGAHDSRESYALRPDGRIDTTFSFSADGFDGPRKTFRSTASVLDAAGAVWGQQYIWPIKADYRVAYLSDDYRHVVIGREKRDYVWIMSRTPTMPDAELDRLIAFVGTQGYDAAKVQRVPQRVR